MLDAGPKRLQARAQLTVKRFMGFWRGRLMGMLSFGDAALKHAVRSAKVTSSPVSLSGLQDALSALACLGILLGPTVLCIFRL